MQTIKDPNAFWTLVQDIKQQGPNQLTNLFVSPEQVQHWIARGVLAVIVEKYVLLVMRKDLDFHHVSFLSSDEIALKTALAGLPLNLKTALTADIVGRPEETDRLSAIFRQAGFNEYVRLCRMVRMNTGSKPPSTAPNDANVELAKATDASAVLESLDGTFDKYAEQLPSLDEVKSAIGRGTILVVRRNSQIAGLLFYELTGITSILRYWMVEPQFRDQRIGAGLMQGYFSRCPLVKRFLLWVKTTNNNAIIRYQHYGYKSDRLMDQIMIHR